MEFTAWCERIKRNQISCSRSRYCEKEISIGKIGRVSPFLWTAAALWRACHACFLILYTVTTRFPWECAESVPRIDQGFTLPIAVTRERSDRPSLSPSFQAFSPRHPYRIYCRPIAPDNISRLSNVLCSFFFLSLSLSFCLRNKYRG